MILKFLIILLPFLLIVRGSVCAQSQGWIVNCIYNDAVQVLLGVLLAFSVLIVAACNEWRGSIVETMNGMILPRLVRMIAIVGAVMVGEIQRAAIRVHHAYAARGEVSPSFKMQNLAALPRILAHVWASMLYESSDRISMQWSSKLFWDHYVPPLAITFVATFSRWSDNAIFFLVIIALAELATRLL